MRVGAVDIGTNSMRLLIMDGPSELGRWVEVTGLGRGVDTTGRLDEEAVAGTIEVLQRFGQLMEEHGVHRRRAIATSASRDASNRDSFFDQAGTALGVRPTLIDGEEEARLAFAGATAGFDATDPVLVSDIGGGSTEFVTAGFSRSIDIGSVRLTERAVPDRPAGRSQIESARRHLRDLFADVDAGPVMTVVGVAGTWTSLSAIALVLPHYDRDQVHLSRITSTDLEGLTDRLSGLSVEQTAAIPSLDPKRAPVILAGALIASAVLETVGIDEAIVSERDTLDAVAAELADLA